MFIDKNSIIINDVSFAKYLIEVEYDYNKMWGKDTGRETLDGSFSGTLLGIFPKIILKFGRLNQQQIEEIDEILDSAFQTLQYDDPKKGKITISTYSGDWALVYKRPKIAQPFSASFISTKRRQ